MITFSSWTYESWRSLAPKKIWKMRKEACIFGLYIAYSKPPNCNSSTRGGSSMRFLQAIINDQLLVFCHLVMQQTAFHNTELWFFSTGGQMLACDHKPKPFGKLRWWLQLAIIQWLYMAILCILTPSEINASTKKRLFQKEVTSSNHWFSGVMLEKGGVITPQ